MDDELKNTLRYLRLSGLLAHWDEYLTLARRQHFSPVRLLRHVVEEESKIRQEHARQRRLARARIPELLRMETFPFERQPKLDKKRILSLYDAFDLHEPESQLDLGRPDRMRQDRLGDRFPHPGHSARVYRPLRPVRRIGWRNCSDRSPIIPKRKSSSVSVLRLPAGR